MTTAVESKRARLSKAVVAATLAAAGLAATGGLAQSTHFSAPAAADVTTDALKVSPLGSANCGFVNTWLAPRPGGRQHLGVDIMASAGTPLLAVVDGTISRLNADYPGSSAGNHINVRTAGGTTYYVYLHLQSFAAGMAVGTTVKAGDVIGYVGSTGSSSAPHLHFEVHPNGGSAVDPTGYVAAIGTCGKNGINRPSTTVVGTPTTVTKTPTTVAPVTTGPSTTAPSANASSGATRIRTTPTTPTVSTTPVTPAAPATTTGAASGGPVATTPAGPATTVYVPPTTAAPVVTAPPVVPNSLGVDVMLSGIVPANQTVSAKVVGGYGLRDAAQSVDITISTTASWGGQGMAGPCGADWLVGYGTAFTVPAGESQARVSVSPGHDGHICITTSADTSFRVTIDAYR